MMGLKVHVACDMMDIACTGGQGEFMSAESNNKDMEFCFEYIHSVNLTTNFVVCYRSVNSR